MKKLLRFCSYCIAILAIFVVLVSLMPQLNRTGVGRFVRFILGSGLAAQNVEDLYSDISSVSRAEMMRWADRVLKDYDAGVIPNEEASSWHVGTIKVPDGYIPEWFPAYWQQPAFGISPELALFVDDNGAAQYIVFAWYLKGVIFFGSRGGSLDIRAWRSHDIHQMWQRDSLFYPYAQQK